MDDDDFSENVSKALGSIGNTRERVARHLRQIAGNESMYDSIIGLPYHAREFLLAAAEIIEEDGRRLN